MTDQNRPRFDGTVTLGNILTVVGFAFAAVAAYYAVRTELSVVGTQVTTVSTRVERMETQLTAMNQVLIADARRAVEIEELRRRMTAVERSVESR